MCSTRAASRLLLGLLLAIALFSAPVCAQQMMMVGVGAGSGSAPAILSSHLTNHNTSSGSGVTVGNGTTTINTTGATLIVIVNSQAQNGTCTITSSPSAGTFTKLTLYGDSGTEPAIQIQYLYNPTTNAAQTFSGSGTGCYQTLDVLPISGSFVGTEEGANGTDWIAGITSQQIGSTGTLTAPNAEICLATWTGGTNAITPTIDTGFNTIDYSNGGTGHYNESQAWLVPTATTALNPTWMFSTESVGAAGIACFK